MSTLPPYPPEDGPGVPSPSPAEPAPAPPRPLVAHLGDRRRRVGRGRRGNRVRGSAGPAARRRRPATPGPVRPHRATAHPPVPERHARKGHEDRRIRHHRRRDRSERLDVQRRRAAPPSDTTFTKTVTGSVSDIKTGDNVIVSGDQLVRNDRGDVDHRQRRHRGLRSAAPERQRSTGNARPPTAGLHTAERRQFTPPTAAKAAGAADSTVATSASVR